jgi:hypothetical protein
MGTWSVGSCGGYNVLFHDRADGPSLYFDQTSGKLVGAAEVPQVTPSTWCRSAPGVAFDPPDCGSSFTAQLPGWCSPSGDADAGSRAFPCCETTADRCPGSAFLCPTVWRDSRVALSQFCQPLVSGANPQAGACGGYDVIRYLSGTTERTLYYDATGALVAEIAADSLCEYGPVNGIELPICSSSLPAICPDGGVDGGADGP